MSIKLYTGIRFQEASFEDLHRKMVAIRPVLAAEVLHRCRTCILNMAIARHEHELFAGERPLKVMSRSMDEFRQKALEANTRGYFSPIDYRFSVTVAPYRGRFYGVHHGHREIAKRFLALSGAEDYHYQDQSDEPEDVSARDWATRKHIWEQIFEASPSWTPSEVGSTFELIPQTPTFMYGERSDYEAQMPALDETRFEVHARRFLREAVIEGRLPECGAPAPNAASGPSAELKAIDKLNEWLKTPSGQARLAREVEAVAQLLPATIAFDDLWPPVLQTEAG